MEGFIYLLAGEYGLTTRFSITKWVNQEISNQGAQCSLIGAGWDEDDCQQLNDFLYVTCRSEFSLPWIYTGHFLSLVVLNCSGVRPPNEAEGIKQILDLTFPKCHATITHITMNMSPLIWSMNFPTTLKNSPCTKMRYECGVWFYDGGRGRADIAHINPPPLLSR